MRLPLPHRAAEYHAPSHFSQCMFADRALLSLGVLTLLRRVHRQQERPVPARALAPAAQTTGAQSDYFSCSFPSQCMSRHVCKPEPLQRCGRIDTVMQRLDLSMQSQHCLGALRSWWRALACSNLPNAQCESHQGDEQVRLKLNNCYGAQPQSGKRAPGGRARRAGAHLPSHAPMTTTSKVSPTPSR